MSKFEINSGVANDPWNSPHPETGWYRDRCNHCRHPRAEEGRLKFRRFEVNQDFMLDRQEVRERGGNVEFGLQERWSWLSYANHMTVRTVNLQKIWPKGRG